MNEVELRNKYMSEMHIYEAWGNFAWESILDDLSKKVDIKLFIKADSTLRLKEVNSLINKAFYRGKNYKDPYNEITDKVAMRFVVLLVEDIKLICEIVEKNSNWTFSQDRNFEEERLRSPEAFTYQSFHYIITNKEEIYYREIGIPKGIACEIQIRTLLQHAYSELTHDTVYKPKTKAKPMVHRLVARSMALIEATDELFGEVSNMIRANDSFFQDFMRKLDEMYSTFTEPEYDKQFSMYIFDAYSETLNSIDIDDIESFVNKNAFIKDIILKKYERSLLYRQPIILLLYYLISSKRKKASELWPLTDNELAPLYADLGFSMPD